MYNKMNGNFCVELHTFMNDGLKAEVWKTVDGHYGCRFWRDKVWLKDEVYEGYSESYAEDAADNYVLGIKTI
ncbi:hypothetical protein CBD41_08815 [bacterium TMED181]|nr:MAG: hypothetical protein CBD41_08815 [bacterium TMED181]